jgi:uncharacterized membrane protein YjgN (DUF898 family)
MSTTLLTIVMLTLFSALKIYSVCTQIKTDRCTYANTAVDETGYKWKAADI